MKFINITKQELNPVTITITSNAYYDPDYSEVLETVNIAHLREQIKHPPLEIRITTKRYLTEVLLRTITPCYLRGSRIIINGKACKQVTCNPQYFFKWVESIPSKLPQNLKDAYRSFNLKGELYNELITWNQARVEKAKSASQFKWEIAEQWYKNLYKYFNTHKIVVQSPNKKTFYEAQAELDFEQWCPIAHALTIEESEFLIRAESKNYIRAFGLQDTTFQVGSHHRTTPHGTTYEEVITNANAINSTITNNYFLEKDGSNNENSFTDDTGFVVQQWNSTRSHQVVSHTKERENIISLKFFLSLSRADQQELLLPGWSFCSKCNCAVHESHEHCEICDQANPNFRELIPYNDDTHDNNDDDDLD